MLPLEPLALLLGLRLRLLRLRLRLRLLALALAAATAAATVAGAAATATVDTTAGAGAGDMARKGRWARGARGDARCNCKRLSYCMRQAGGWTDGGAGGRAAMLIHTCAHKQVHTYNCRICALALLMSLGCVCNLPL